MIIGPYYCSYYCCYWAHPSSISNQKSNIVATHYISNKLQVASWGSRVELPDVQGDLFGALTTKPLEDKQCQFVYIVTKHSNKKFIMKQNYSKLRILNRIGQFDMGIVFGDLFYCFELK
jgi:hypothetical protein